MTNRRGIGRKKERGNLERGRGRMREKERIILGLRTIQIGVKYICKQIKCFKN